MPSLCLTYKSHSNLFINSLTYCSLNHSSSNSLIHSFTHSFFCLYHLFIYPCIYSSESSTHLIQLLISYPFIHLFILFWVICSFIHSLLVIHFSDIFWLSRGERLLSLILKHRWMYTGSKGWTSRLDLFNILGQKILDFCSPLWSDVMTLGGKLFTILYVYSLGTLPGLDQVLLWT